MIKPIVDYNFEPLRYISNEAYFFFHDNMWGKKQENTEVPTKKDKAMALTLGFTSGFIAANLGKYIIYPLMKQPLGEFRGIPPTLEEIATISIAGTAAVGIYKSIQWFKNQQEYIQEHPLYVRGFTAVMAGASIAGINELVK